MLDAELVIWSGRFLNVVTRGDIHWSARRCQPSEGWHLFRLESVMSLSLEMGQKSHTVTVA